MKAIGVTRGGGPDVLEVIEAPAPAPSPSQHLIRVHAAAVNPTDLLSREAGEKRLSGPPPWIVGMDLAGIIEVPARDSELPAGTRVMAMVVPTGATQGAQAELVVVSRESTVAIPDDVTFVEASTVPMNGLTAHLALETMNLRGRSTIAVAGGAGHLASFFIPLARGRGHRVIADADVADSDRVVALGAEVVARGPELSQRIRCLVPEGVDALLNAAALGPEILGALGDGGMLVAVRDWPGATERDIAIRRILVSAYLDNPAPLEDIRAALAAGTIRPNVADVFSPHDAADAHRRLEAGGVRGRLVFDLSSWHSER